MVEAYFTLLDIDKTVRPSWLKLWLRRIPNR